MSVRLSVCPIDRPQQRYAAGLLLGVTRVRDIDRQRRAPNTQRLNTAPQHGAAAANAGSVTFTAAVAG